jgi:hypothetical protein
MAAKRQRDCLRHRLGRVVTGLPRRALDLDDQHPLRWHAVERFRERRYDETASPRRVRDAVGRETVPGVERSQRFERNVRNATDAVRRRFEAGVVDEHERAVGREPNIDFDAIGSREEPRVDRGQRVLGRESRGAAMTDQLHRAHPAGTPMSRMLLVLPVDLISSTRVRD